MEGGGSSFFCFFADDRFFGKNFQRILEDLLKNFGKGKWSEVRGGPGSWDFLKNIFGGIFGNFLIFVRFFGGWEGCREFWNLPFKGGDYLWKGAERRGTNI